jgi:hypothetical protein
MLITNLYSLQPFNFESTPKSVKRVIARRNDEAIFFKSIELQIASSVDDGFAMTKLTFRSGLNFINFMNFQLFLYLLLNTNY